MRSSSISTTLVQTWSNTSAATASLIQSWGEMGGSPCRCHFLPRSVGFCSRCSSPLRMKPTQITRIARVKVEIIIYVFFNLSLHLSLSFFFYLSIYLYVCLSITIYLYIWHIPYKLLFLKDTILIFKCMSAELEKNKTEKKNDNFINLFNSFFLDLYFYSDLYYLLNYLQA